MLFTSFEHYKPLARVLDEIGRVFGEWLEKQGVHWLALSDARRREVAHQVMEQIPLLWIWDNVVLVGQALRDGLRTRAEVEAFVQRLRAGSVSQSCWHRGVGWVLSTTVNTGRATAR